MIRSTPCGRLATRPSAGQSESRLPDELTARHDGCNGRPPSRSTRVNGSRDWLLVDGPPGGIFGAGSQYFLARPAHTGGGAAMRARRRRAAVAVTMGWAGALAQRPRQAHLSTM